MKLIYCVKDVVAGEFYTPQLYNNEALALRSYDDLLKSSPFAKDFQLWKLGEFDTETGKIFSDVVFIRGGN